MKSATAFSSVSRRVWSSRSIFLCRQEGTSADARQYGSDPAQHLRGSFSTTPSRRQGILLSLQVPLQLVDVVSMLLMFISVLVFMLMTQFRTVGMAICM